MARTMPRNQFTYTNRSDHDKIASANGDDDKKEIWSTLLNNVSSSKRLPEKDLIILGGTQESQRDFIESLSQQPPHLNRTRPSDRSRDRKPAIANQFALGYTYQDVYDTDHEDVLARLSLYTLDEPTTAYAPLLARLLTPTAIPNTAVAILLDWNEPWKFVRTLRAWLQLLMLATKSLAEDANAAVEENIKAYRQARDGEPLYTKTDAHTPIALGKGEYDAPLGLPLCVVCQNALAMEKLERERGYRESHFDYILQFLRTVLLKHGAALIYTMPGQSSQLQTLVHDMLNIHSTLLDGRLASRDKAGKTPKHNVVDREGVLVPPGWDSWGKIKILREDFDVEGTSQAWSDEVQSMEAVHVVPTAGNPDNADHTPGGDAVQGAPNNLAHNSPITLYEAHIQDPRPPKEVKVGIEIATTPDQDFLAVQLELLERLRADDEAAKKQRERDGAGKRQASGAAAADTLAGSSSSRGSGGGSMHEQIGPVQFNMGGIQYDADEAVRRLKERHKPAPFQGTPERSRASRDTTPFSPNSPLDAKDIPVENLEAYFASLMKGGRAGSASVTNSPRPSRES